YMLCYYILANYTLKSRAHYQNILAPLTLRNPYIIQIRGDPGGFVLGKLISEPCCRNAAIFYLTISVYPVIR
ncbi:MAG: hypothetical protein Q7V36_04485, partial [Deltaproteobacteria bacterium]|nr:hypothetical protein [Deltaproteobacteria bacterium]